MGSTESTEKVYGKFQGEEKPGESRVLRHVMTILQPGEPQTMLEELK